MILFKSLHFIVQWQWTKLNNEKNVTKIFKHETDWFNIEYIDNKF